MAYPPDFKGRAKRLDDIDLPKLGARIGVGEDEIHAVLDVESRGSGFDKSGRPLILFEPHRFWANLGPGAKRDRAAALGLAYPKWGTKPYPADSYPRLRAAMAIDATAALKAASWGLGQIMGENHEAAGYSTVEAMVAAMCEDEENHLAAMVAFIRSNHLDDELRAHSWAAFARGYNGPGYAKNQYDVRLARAYARWLKIPDTKWSRDDAAAETGRNDPVAAHVVVAPAQPIAAAGGSSGGAGASGTWEAPPAPAPQPTPIITPKPPSPPAPAVVASGGVWARLSAWLGWA